MRYEDLIKAFDEISAQKPRELTPDQQAAAKRLKELNRQRLDSIRDALFRELRSGYSEIELERDEMMRRLRR